MSDNWIWLPEVKYPQYQTTCYSGFNNYQNGNYTVAEFKKEYSFDKKVKTVCLRFSADTEFQLYLNDQIIATGPACVGGDFMGNESPRDNFYYQVLTLTPDTNVLHFFSRVKMMPVKICEYSKGHGGFMLRADITFEDGTTTNVYTDETWLTRRNGAYNTPYSYDGRIPEDEYVFAQSTENIWNATLAPIEIRCEEELMPKNSEIVLQPHEQRCVSSEFDMIYAGFIKIEAVGDGVVFADISCKEIDEEGSHESIILKGNQTYRGFALHSVGKYVVKLQNDSDTVSKVFISLISTYYPIYKNAEIHTSDEQLNKILKVCRHTLKYCRQTHHLDSPRHCEPLACTGDYYIETLMTAFSFGDMSLSRFDITRTAELLRQNDGQMFHTTYSLIWVRMLWDVYMFTGDIALLRENIDALKLLLGRFKRYIGQNGIIESPPNYMFVDWIYIDELSMHHPPKALGQTCLNMFYYGALRTALKIYNEIGDGANATECEMASDRLKSAINGLLFDKNKGLYFEGLNTPTDEKLLHQFMPQNTDKRYYLKHSNILSAYFGVCENPEEIIEKIMTDECEGDYQPYFAHYLLEAIYENGLRDKYTLPLIERWKQPVGECSKGLVEGFITPEPNYGFDHSHAWGGTPLYSLPKALIGLKIDKPGMSELTLTPSLLGLENAYVELPTQYGNVTVNLNRGKTAVISAPKEIKINI